MQQKTKNGSKYIGVDRNWILLPKDLSIIKVIVFLLAFAGLSFAENVKPDLGTSLQVNGQYERQSVTHPDFLLFAHDVSLKDTYAAILLAKMMDLRIPRFDDNPVSARSVKRFLNAYENHPPKNVERFEEMVKETFLPDIESMLERKAAQRAAERVNEGQQNTGISMKTHDAPATASQDSAARNSGWLYIPFVTSVNSNIDKKIVNVSIGVTLLWYRVKHDESGDASIEIAHTVSEVGNGGGVIGQYDVSPDNAMMVAFQAAASATVAQLLSTSKELPEFRLCGQVQSVDGMSLTIDIGKRDGVRTNDRYLVMEIVKNDSGRGNGEPREVGWVRVMNHVDSAGASARRVGGQVYTGLALKEVASSGWSIVPGLQHYMFDVSGQDLTTNVVHAEFLYQPSWWPGIHFGYGIGFGYGSNDVQYGRESFDLAMLQFGFRADMRQEFNYGPWGVFIQPEYSVYFANAKVGDQEASNGALLERSVLFGLQYEVSPRCDLEIYWGNTAVDAAPRVEQEYKETVGGYYYSYETTKYRSYEFSSSASKIGFQVKYTPKAFWFNPLNMLTTVAGSMGQ